MQSGIIVGNEAEPGSHGKLSDKPKLRDILQKNWPIILENVKATKARTRLKSPPD